jgi:CubicO group peptidase (beta-lactamase class C family)
MHMTKRDFLLSAAASLTACGPRSETSETPIFPPAYAPIREVMSAEIVSNHFPGSVWLVAKGDQVVVDAAGVSAIGSSFPMRPNTIFRIASMTKAITATAVMMLIEERKLTLEESADRLLPELANRRVLRTLNSQIDDTVPANRPISIRDLMNFTFGFGISFDPTLPIMQAAEQQNQLVIGQPVPMTPHDPDEWMRRFGALPLMYQPGERWLYNVGSLILGVLVRRASGQDFDSFVEERITGPLGMADTGFHVPANKLDRFAGCGIFTDPATQQQTRMDQDGAQSAYASRPIFPSGAGGLCSTADDYLIFARMLMAEGEHNGRQLISPDSVRAMTSDQLTAAQRTASAEGFFPGYFDANSWGYGVGVQIAPTPLTQRPGAYGWDGGFGTSWLNDPSRDLISIVMTQSSDFLFNGALDRYRQAVYAATA